MLKNRYWTEYYWFIEWLCTSELGEIVRLYCIGIKQTRDMKLVLKKTQWTSLPSLWECVFLYFVQTLFKLHNWHLVFSNILKLCVFRGENFFKLQRNDDKRLHTMDAFFKLDFYCIFSQHINTFVRLKYYFCDLPLILFSIKAHLLFNYLIILAWLRFMMQCSETRSK